MSQTQIRVNTDTRDKLNKLGLKGESFDDVINRLIDVYEQAKFIGKVKA